MDESYQGFSTNNNNASASASASQRINTNSATAYIANPEIVMDPSYTDSEATNHVTAELDNLTLNADYKGKGKLVIGDGKSLPITHTSCLTLHKSSSKTKSGA